MEFISPLQTLEDHINQNGVRPGLTKYRQFIKACQLRGAPPIYSQDGEGKKATAYVRIFDPCGSWSWYITEFSPETGEAFGLVKGFETELGYFSLEELSEVRGKMGIGLEIDVHFLPIPLDQIDKL
jgi:hypothetical protein